VRVDFHSKQGIGNSPEFRDPAVNRSATSPPDDFWIKSGGGKTSIVRIATGSDWSIEVYLQRFMKQFPAGVHDVAYSINLAVQPPEPGPGLTIEGRGVLGIVITPASDGQLLGMIEELARARPQDADYRPFEESLSLVSSPLIIPYLGKIIPYCLTKSPVLAKFKGNAEAADLVAATALKGGGFQTVSALSVLQEWDFPLSIADFEQVLARGGQSIKAAALEYAEKVNNRSYLPGYPPIQVTAMR
jgi:hypothetical protein